MRAVGLSALVFGGAALLVTLGVAGSLIGLTDMPAGADLFVALLSVVVVPVSLIGALAGPVLARASGAGRAIAIGAVLAVCIVAVLTGLGVAALAAGEWVDVESVQGDAAMLLVVAALAAGVACSPIGGLCGYVVWRVSSASASRKA